MNKEIFLELKVNLTNLINESLAKENITKHNRIGLIKIMELLNSYTFENRLVQKGLLTRTIIDSLELDYSLGEIFLKFDNDIN